MFSIRMPRCSSPRPDPLKASRFSVSVTFRATLDSNSFMSRSRRLRLVTYLPSLPTNGLVLTLNIMVSVGGSMSWNSSGIGLAGSQMLSLMSTDSSPIRLTMSPATASSTFIRPRPSYACTCTTLVLTCVPSRLATTTCWPVLIRPL